MEQPIISKYCQALLDVPPIHGDVTRGPNKHGRHLRVVQLVFDSEIISVSRPNPQALIDTSYFRDLLIRNFDVMGLEFRN